MTRDVSHVALMRTPSLRSVKFNLVQSSLRDSGLFFTSGVQASYLNAAGQLIPAGQCGTIRAKKFE